MSVHGSPRSFPGCGGQARVQHPGDDPHWVFGGICYCRITEPVLMDAVKTVCLGDS